MRASMDLVANWMWQGAVVALALGLVLRGLRRSRAESRYLACWVALVVIVLLPAMPFVLAGGGDAAASLIPQPDTVAIPEGFRVPAALIAIAWATWAVLNTALVVRAIRLLRRARAAAAPFAQGVESRLALWTRVRRTGRPLTLVTSDAVSIAAVLVGRVPAIAVAPGVVAQLADEELERVLLHEWAHVQRRDDLALLLQLFIRIVVGWHPAVWWIERRLHREREIACDEIVLAVAGSPKVYAACLVKLAGLRSRRSPLAAPAIRAGRELRARVATIVSRGEPMSAAMSRIATTALVGGLCVVGVAAGGVIVVDTTPGAVLIPATRIDTISSIAPKAMSAVLVAVEGGSVPADRRALARGTPPAAMPRTQVSVDRPGAPVARPESVGPEERGPEPAAVQETPFREPVTSTAVDTPAAAPAPDTAPASTPWGRTADLGIAIGERSKAAGTGTASAFRRFASRVANSF